MNLRGNVIVTQHGATMGSCCKNKERGFDEQLTAFMQALYTMENDPWPMIS